jgi:tRNA(Ile)-lysidine synthase
MIIGRDFYYLLYNAYAMHLLKTIKSALRKIRPFRRVVIGVSGGADSVALAHALKTLGYEIIIAHLNHRLRGAESDADEKFVKDMAKSMGVVCVTKKSLIPESGNLENNARDIRYAFLEEVRKKYKADHVATAHHMDDQVETVLMHMARGSGLRGQIGIKYQNGRLIRPMLDVKRTEILDYAGKNCLEYRTDESNSDLSLDRNLWRHLVIPYLGNEMPGFYKKIKNIGRRADSRLKNISDKADKWIKKYFTGDSAVTSSEECSFRRAQFSKLADDVKAEILIRILGAKDLYGASLNRLMEFIQSGKSGRKLEIKNRMFFIEHDSVLIRGKSFKIPELPKMRITVSGIKWGEITIKSGYGQALYARQWRAGDRFRPAGMSGTKTLQDFFTDKKIPWSRRSRIPVIVDKNDNIMAVGDMRLADGADDLKKYLSIN